MSVKLLTLCIVHENNRVLLGMKKRGFGAGRYNGFGGKVGSGETIEEAAKREVKEEALITPTNLVKQGVIEFTFTTHQDVLQVHIFKTTAYTGEAGESEEMRPEWFEANKIPFEEMWKDDIFWFPLFLQNKMFKGKFHFDDKDEILEKELKEVTELD
jgi:8-oxo-dGTP pyrophosphatase MutT (NUDIX family)